jgi:hypothetical protein
VTKKKISHLANDGILQVADASREGLLYTGVRRGVEGSLMTQYGSTFCQLIGKSQGRLAFRGCLEQRQGLMVLDESANPTVSVGGLCGAAGSGVETEANQVWYRMT